MPELLRGYDTVTQITALANWLQHHQTFAPQRIWIATTQESVKLVPTYAHRPLNPARPHRPARPSNAELSGILISAFELGFPCWGNTAAQNGPNMPLDP